MKFKGTYSGETSYSVGDVVIYDKTVIILQNPAPAGTPPYDTLYWGTVEKPLAEAVLLMADVLADATSMVAGVQTQFETAIPDAKTLVLASSTASSDKTFAITVDDAGDLAATEITEEGET